MSPLQTTYSKQPINSEKTRALFAWGPEAYWGKKLWSYCRQNQEKAHFVCDNFEIKFDPDVADLDFFKRKALDVDLLVYMWEYSVGESDLGQMKLFLKKAKESGVKKVLLVSQKGASAYESSRSQKRAYDLEMQFINFMFPELYLLRVGVVMPEELGQKKFLVSPAQDTGISQIYSSQVEPLTQAMRILAGIPLVLAVPFSQSRIPLIEEYPFYERVNLALGKVIKGSTPPIHQDRTPRVMILDHEETGKKETLEATLKKIGRENHRHGLRFTVKNKAADALLRFLGLFSRDIKHSHFLLEEAFKTL